VAVIRIILIIAALSFAIFASVRITVSSQPTPTPASTTTSAPTPKINATLEREQNDLLFGRAALHMSSARVREILGRPTHIQAFADETLWYYTRPAGHGDTAEFQIIIQDGGVAEINRY
jgi:hypothetical protein